MQQHNSSGAGVLGALRTRRMDARLVDDHVAWIRRDGGRGGATIANMTVDCRLESHAQIILDSVKNPAHYDLPFAMSMLAFGKALLLHKTTLETVHLLCGTASDIFFQAACQALSSSPVLMGFIMSAGMLESRPKDVCCLPVRMELPEPHLPRTVWIHRKYPEVFKQRLTAVW